MRGPVHRAASPVANMSQYFQYLQLGLTEKVQVYKYILEMVRSSTPRGPSRDAGTISSEALITMYLTSDPDGAAFKIESSCSRAPMAGKPKHRETHRSDIYGTSLASFSRTLTGAAQQSLWT